jgi:hypothetical protein
MYNRNAALPKLIPLWAYELADTSDNGRERIIAMLRLANRSERIRGRAGHWTYSVARHQAIVRALRFERAARKQEVTVEVKQRKAA